MEQHHSRPLVTPVLVRVILITMALAAFVLAASAPVCMTC